MACYTGWMNISQEFKLKEVENVGLSTRSQWYDMMKEDPAVVTIQILL